MLYKYDKFMENNKNIDPFNEENWDDDKEKNINIPVQLNRERMINDIINEIMSNMYEYEDYIRGILHDYLTGSDNVYLKDMIDRDVLVECPVCDGLGQVGDGEMCQRCDGSGEIDYYEYEYGN